MICLDVPWSVQDVRETLAIVSLPSHDPRHISCLEQLRSEANRLRPDGSRADGRCGRTDHDEPRWWRMFLQQICDALNIDFASRASSEAIVNEILPAIARLREQAAGEPDPLDPLRRKLHEPDRPEPVDPSEVRVRDLVKIEATDGRLHRGPVLAATSSDFLVGMPGEGTHGIAYQHSDLRQRATVRILQSAQPDPEAAIERARAVWREHTNTGLVERCKCLACDMARALDGTEATDA